MKRSTRLQRLELITGTLAHGRRRELINRLIEWAKAKPHEQVASYMMTNTAESIAEFFTGAPAGVLAEVNEIEQRMAELGTPLPPALDEIESALISTLTDDELRRLIAQANTPQTSTQGN